MESLAVGKVLCEHCTAACCRYVALPIDTPENARDFDDMRWYVMHENIAVFVEEGDWFIQIHNPCRNVQADGRCRIYATRPAICREYTPAECDYHIGDEPRGPYFDNPEELMAFAREFLRRRESGPNGRAGRKSARPKARRTPQAVTGNGTPPSRK